MTSQGVFTAREFRDALGLFPTGIAVVTALSGAGEKLGVTVSSFSSISLDPPLVSFGLAKSAHSFDDWVAAPHFAHQCADRRAGTSFDEIRTCSERQMERPVAAPGGRG